MNTVTYNPKVQVLRAFAIVAVVFIHTCPDGMFQVCFRPFVNFGVGLFLFLSGWLTRPQETWLPFFRKRIVRVLVPYIIWTVIYALQKGALDKISCNLLTAKANAAFYYIFVYVQFVLLTPLLFRLAQSRLCWAGWLVAPLSVVLFRYVPYALGLPIPSLVNDFWSICCMGWLCFYYLGLLMGNGLLYCPGGRSHKSSSRVSDGSFPEGKMFFGMLVLLAVSLCAQIMEGYLWLRLGWPNCGSQLKMTSLLTTLAVLLLANKWLTGAGSVDCSSVKSAAWAVRESFRGRVCRLLICVGDRSFGIYLIHILVMRMLADFPFYRDLPFGVNTILVFLVSFLCVSIGVSILGHCGSSGRYIARWLGLS